MKLSQLNSTNLYHLQGMCLVDTISFELVYVYAMRMLSVLYPLLLCY